NSSLGGIDFVNAEVDELVRAATDGVEPAAEGRGGETMATRRHRGLPAPRAGAASQCEVVCPLYRMHLPVEDCEREPGEALWHGWPRSPATVCRARDLDRR